MRDRPFIQANEPPRPFSDVVAERRISDPAFRQREQVVARIQEIEGEAAGADHAGERKSLQCEAEALRLELDEGCIGHGKPLRANDQEVTQ